MFLQKRTIKPGNTRCKGTQTKQLSNVQWAWLDEELSKKSVIKVIASSIQVLPPTNQLLPDYNDIDGGIIDLCSHDIHSNPNSGQNKYCTLSDTTEFCKAISDVGENHTWVGTIYETWSLIPQERRKLLQKAQLSINRGNAKFIIFVSGDQHWGELMTKKMPRIPNVEGRDGNPQTLYEVTGSGIFQNWEEDVPNSNRFKDRTEKRSIFRGACNDSKCVPASQAHNRTFGKGIMCAISQNVSDNWHDVYTVCDPIDNDYYDEYLSAESNLTSTCSGSKYHTCSSKGNYGSITVDFDMQIVTLSIKTPNENEEAKIKITY